MTKRRRDLDFPFDKVREEAAGHRRKGAIIFQKWTCGGCGRRLAGAPDGWTDNGRCEEIINGKECGYITNLRKTGCNFTLIWVSDPKRRQEIVNMARALGPIGVPEGKA